MLHEMLHEMWSTIRWNRQDPRIPQLWGFKAGLGRVKSGLGFFKAGLGHVKGGLGRFKAGL